MNRRTDDNGPRQANELADAASRGAAANRLLRTAATDGALAAVDAAIANGADIKRLPLDCIVGIAEAGHADVMARLIAAGLDVRQTRDLAIRHAAMYGHRDTVECLLRAGADPNAGAGLPLRAASNLGSMPVVEQLLAAGADVHASDDRALYYAADSGHTHVMRRLLDAGADPALPHAQLKSGGHSAAARLLMETHREWVKQRAAAVAADQAIPPGSDAAGAISAPEELGL